MFGLVYCDGGKPSRHFMLEADAGIGERHMPKELMKTAIIQ